MNLETDKELIEAKKQWEQKGYQKYRDMTLKDIFKHKNKLRKRRDVLMKKAKKHGRPSLENILAMKQNLMFMILLGMREFDITGVHCGEK